jgi:hypothetical protein
LLATILGRGVTLPGECRFAGGKAEGSIVTAEYDCGGRGVVLELRSAKDAPAAAVRTEQFSIVPRSGSVPPGLTDALAARIRSHESSFHWQQTSEPRPTSARIGRSLSVAAGLSGILIVGLAVQFLVRRRLPDAPAWAHSAAISFPVVLIAAGALCALAHASLQVTGTLASAVLWEKSAAELLVSTGRLAALIPAAMLVATFTTWLAPSWPLRAGVALTVILYLVVGHWMSLVRDDLHYFGAVSTLPPSSAPPVTSDAAAITYRTNAFGLREPAFDAVKAQGVVRVALVGDSFVYGIGVDEDDTLRAHLAERLANRWPDQRFEVLNLGIPGNNLASHVELFAAAIARLDLDAVILCLTLPNDLSRWDAQIERQDARRLGTFSFVRFLTGDAASSLWAAMRLETAITPASLAYLDEQMTRLDEIRRRSTKPRVLLFFAFHAWDPAVIARLKRIPETAVVPDGTIAFEDFIPGDGHPTSIGNTRSAQRIANTLDENPAWLALVPSEADN